MNIIELREEAALIVEGLGSGVGVGSYSGYELRLALAYRMWSDGQDTGLNEFLDPAIWTDEAVRNYLVNVFGYLL